MADTVHPELVTLYNHAARTGRAGDHAAAIALYRTALARMADPEALPATGAFVATVHMRIGFCLMDLARHEEALAAFAQAQRLRAELDTAGQYELFFALGNTFGQLGRLDECFSALVSAISRAEDLDDYTERPARCWEQLLAHGARAEAWPFVRTKAEIALNTARLRGIDALAATATRVLAALR